MSIAGAKPALGHLGVILYGEAAVNDVRDGQRQVAVRDARRGRSAMGDRRVQHRRPAQPGGAARLRRGVPRLARHVEFRRALRVADGVERQQRRSRRATRLLDVHRVAQHAARSRPRAISCSPAPGLPLGALLWTFGTPVARRRRRLDRGASAGSRSGRGFLTLGPDANDRIALVSPRGLPAQVQRAEDFVLGFDGPAGLRRVRVQGRSAARTADGRRWRTRRDRRLRMTAAGVAIKRTAGRSRDRDRSGAHRDHVCAEHGEGADANRDAVGASTCRDEALATSGRG